MSISEDLRLAELDSYHLLDEPVDAELEAVVRLAASVTGSTRATLNLIGSDRQCQVATQGFVGGDSPRDASMCNQVFRDGVLVHTADATQDPRFAGNPWVDGRLARVRHYSSAPLVTADGHALGSLCVFDEHPRALTATQLTGLDDLAIVVLSLFERRREARRIRQLAAKAEEQYDLMDIVLAEAEARQELTDAVLDTIDVAVVACDADGEVTLRNRTARDWQGDQLNGRALFAADGTSPLLPDQRPLARTLAEGRLEGAELVIASPGRASVRAVASGRSLLRSDGAVLGAVVAMTDVTADRAQRAELQRSNAELEHFAAIAGHDLAAPLGVVAGYLELLEDSFGEELDDLARGWVGTMQAGVARMASLIDALLSYARAGNALTAVRSTDLASCLELALVDLSSLVSAAGAEVTAGSLPVVPGDAVLLRQLLQNLVGNAVKHREPGRPCRVSVTAVERDGSWEVSVADNGAGVPVAHRRSVFGMFTTAGATPGTGHGIGLATCSRIVDQHGGSIWLDETPGGGATVRFTVPAGVPADKARQAA
jgi:signal transduction histidine kinase